MTLAQRMALVLRRMSILQEGSVAKLDKDATRASDRGSIIPTFRDVPLSVEWHDRFERLVIAAEQDLESCLKRGQRDIHPSGRPRVANLRKRLHEYTGRDCAWVAFVERCSVKLVEKARTDAGLDSKWGFKREAPLTSIGDPTAMGVISTQDTPY